MVDRRRFLGAAALAGTVALAPGIRAAERSAPVGSGPGRTRLAIDGAGGSSLFWLGDDDPSIPAELAHLRASGLTALVVTVAPSGRFWLDDAAFRKTQDAIARWHRLVARHPDALAMIERHGDLVAANRGGRVGIVLTFQGTESIGEDPERIGLFHRQGVRVIQLTHNRRNLVGDGCMEPGNAGLSVYGRQVVERLNAQRIVVDLAHASQRTTAEAIRASSAPVLISHTGCRALADLPRNTADAELRAMADRGGVAGIIFWPYLRTDSQPMAADVVRHIEHAIDVCGEDHIGIGTDGPVAPIERSDAFEADNREVIAGMKRDGIFAADRPDELYTFIPDLNRADRFQVLAGLLADRGHAAVRIDKLLGGNFARVLGQVWG